jgi:hypothetical protein
MCQYSWCCYNSSKWMEITWDRIIQGRYFMWQLPSTFTQITSDSVAFVTILVCHQLQYSALVHSIALNIMFQPYMQRSCQKCFCSGGRHVSHVTNLFYIACQNSAGFCKLSKLTGSCEWQFWDRLMSLEYRLRSLRAQEIRPELRKWSCSIRSM